MTPDIARPTSPEILPRPPFHRVINTRGKWPRRRSSEPQIPFEGRGRLLASGRARARHPIVLHCSEAVGTKIGVFDFPNASFLEPKDGRAIVQAGCHLGAELSMNAFLN